MGNGKIVNGRESAVSYAKKLMTQKEGIQAEMEANFSILSANESTMNSPLVDSEGFPRADIDVYAVRHARVRIIELRNDMKAIMDNIAEALAAVHSAAQAEAAAEKEAAMDTGGENVEDELQVFARVDAVMPGSPAASAGLMREDLLLQFGDLTAASFPSSLQPLAALVSSHENTPLQIKLRRQTEIVTLSFTPRRDWGGRGLLGCHIVPYRP